MIKTLTLVAGAALLLAACGQKEAEPTADNTAGPVVATGTAGNEAVDTTPTQDPAAAASGASSFTEAQARAAFEKAGYAVTGPLTQSPDGIWQAMTMMNGNETTMGIDYKGAITQR